MGVVICWEKTDHEALEFSEESCKKKKYRFKFD